MLAVRRLSVRLRRGLRAASIESAASVESVEFLRANTARVRWRDGRDEVCDTRALRQRDEAWIAARAALDTTASEFACAGLDASPYLSREALLARRASSPRGGWFEDDTIDNPATRFGRESERLAVDQYRNDTGFDVRSTGLWTSEDLRFGASPDGLVVDPTTGDEGLLEVKCLYGQRRRKVVRASAPPARFAPQIQGQLALTGFEWCDLVLWVPQHVVYFRVRRDPLYWEFFLRPKLLEFSDELRARRRALVDTAE